jgi:hypothetical protein
VRGGLLPVTGEEDWYCAILATSWADASCDSVCEAGRGDDEVNGGRGRIDESEELLLRARNGSSCSSD